MDLVQVPKPVLVVLVLLLALILSVSAQSSRGCKKNAPVPAANVIGQPTLSTSNTGYFDGPLSPAISPASGKLFVSNVRAKNIMRYSSAALYMNGAPPDLAFFGPGSACKANQFRAPAGLFVDPDDNLYVTDPLHSRVLVFKGASAVILLNPFATKVFGQPDFTTCTSGTNFNQLNGAQAVHVDSDRDVLYISDSLNSRVLRFDSLSTQPKKNAFANVAFGVAQVAGCSANLLFTPFDVTVDSNGNLWVADQGNNRVLRFNAASTKSSGAAADLVIGAPDFTTCAPDTSASTFNQPLSVTFDPLGTLYVSDTGNNRVMGFLQAVSLSANGPNADFQIGQPNFKSSKASPPVSASSLNRPQGIVFDPSRSGSLLVASGQENRVLRYCTAALSADVSASNTDAPPSPSPTSSLSTGASPTNTIVPSSSTSFGFTATESSSAAPTGSDTSSISGTAQPTASQTGSAQPTSSQTGAATGSDTSSGSASAAASAAATSSPTSSAAATASPTSSAASTTSPTSSAAASATASPSNVPTSSNTVGLSASGSPSRPASNTGASSQSGTAAASPSRSSSQPASSQPSGPSPSSSRPVCGDGVVSGNEQCDPPSKSNCCNSHCMFEDVGDICKAPDSCHYARRCCLANPNDPNSGVICKPAQQKPVGTICSLLPLKTCNSAGQCVPLL